MGVRRLAAHDRETTPWRNGAGTTAQIAAWPSSCALEDLGWRVSVATIAASAPFSAYPGVDRVLTALAPSAQDPLGGLVLDVDGRERSVEPFVPHAFSGDSEVRGSIRGGPVRVLNVMTRRGSWRSEVEVPAPLTSSVTLSSAPGRRTVVVMLEGGADLFEQSGTMSLGNLDAAALSGTTSVRLVPRTDAGSTPPRVALVRLYGAS